jgi:hypothetical protein
MDSDLSFTDQFYRADVNQWDTLILPDLGRRPIWEFAQAIFSDVAYDHA